MGYLTAGLWVLASLYALGQFLSWFYWLRQRSKANILIKGPIHCNHSVLAIVPARNEAARIAATIDCLKAQDYSNFKYIIVNDHSTDDTLAVLESLGAPILNLPIGLSGKKAAITAAIEANPAIDLIFCTDADCIFGPDWVSSGVKCFTKYGYHWIGAPVHLTDDGSIWQRFQALDFAGMMLLTGAGIEAKMPILANGANHAYRREAFVTVGGYSGLLDTGSGDDMQLMLRIKDTFGEQALGYRTKPADAVFTPALSDISSFIKQRVRWGGKARSAPHFLITGWLSVTWLYCLALLLLLIAAVLTFNPSYLLFWIPKLIFDWLVLFAATGSFKRRHLRQVFPLASLMHPVYIASVGFMAMLPQTYDWKGRHWRK
jgi:cellulose synthase/poly-beta-1,6-N-acetylglucosamine synthase-like glycosyltransferase